MELGTIINAGLSIEISIERSLVTEKVLSSCRTVVGEH